MSSHLSWHDFPQAGLYARASKWEDSEAQLVPLRARALKEGWESREYVDSGPESPQRDQLLADAKAGRIEVVLFHNMRAWCEDGLTATIDLLDELAFHGVSWLTLLEESSESVAMLRKLQKLAGKKGEKTCPKKLLQ
jgi:hypothetical protein